MLGVVCGSHFLPSDYKASPLLSTSAAVFYGMASTDVCVCVCVCVCVSGLHFTSTPASLHSPLVLLYTLDTFL